MQLVSKEIKKPKNKYLRTINKTKEVNPITG